jgi:hypothetical protein
MKGIHIPTRYQPDTERGGHPQGDRNMDTKDDKAN